MRRVAASCVLLCACAQLTGVADLSIGEKPSDTTPTNDSGKGDATIGDTGAQSDAPSKSDPPADAPGIDTGSDAPPTCTALPTNQTFQAAPGAEWSMQGNASAALPGVRLTPSVGGMIGALWWNSSFMFERFDITFAYVITTDAASTTYGPGDGMAFAWVASGATPTLDATKGGGGMGMQGLTGWAVAIDAYQNTELGDPATPNISIKNTVDYSTLASTAVNAALIDGNVHTVRVRLANGAVTIALDGADVLGPTALPGYTAFDGYFGFGAGTGGAFEDHLLKSVTARIGSTGPCAAP